MSKQPGSTLSPCQGTDIASEPHSQTLLALVLLNLLRRDIPVDALLPMGPLSKGALASVSCLPPAVFGKKWFF